MKNLLLSITLVLSACVTAPAGYVTTEPTGPVFRTVERVLVRTERYMDMEVRPMEVSDVMEASTRSDIVQARALLASPQVLGTMMTGTMGQVMDLHDMLVSMDAELEAFERNIYLGDTNRLRALFNAVASLTSQLATTI